MSSETKTFSESWYRIADRRVALSPHVEVKRQVLRGERFFILRNPFTNAFFRLRPAAYAFVARLRMDRTVDAAWRECMEADPDGAPGQDQVLRLLSQLHASHLLQSNLPPDAAQVFERYQKRRRQEVKSTFANVLFARFSVFNPDPYLRKLVPLLRLIISPVGALVWLALMISAGKTLVDHGQSFFAQGEGLLSPANLPFLFLAMGGLKLCHEFGHAAVCRRFGGEVPTLGVMLMLLTPVPFVDTTSSWAFPSRWQRVLVGMAGMLAESVIAAIAVFVWANTGPGALHGIAYNVIFVASIATLIFNLNPLLRFDGYYILADWLEIPNLQARSTQQLQYLGERYLLGNKQARGPVASRREKFWLSAYGLLSNTYRLFVSFTILLFLATRYLLLGQILFVVGVLSWVLYPLSKLVRFVATAPQLMKSRRRAYAVCFGLLAVIFCVLQFVPAPRSLQAPGVLQSVADSAISARAPGRVEAVLVFSGSRVKQGQPLLRLENPELQWEIKAAEAELKEAWAQRQRAQEEALADLEPIDSRIKALERQLKRLRDDESSLVIRAPHDGIWYSQEAFQLQRTWLPRGLELGRVIDGSHFLFSAVISQEEASHLFGGTISKAAVRLRGDTWHELTAKTFQAIPAEQERLPSAALGWGAGGEIATSATDSEGVQVRETFFEVRSPVTVPEGVMVRHGTSGRIRFEMPSEPLLPQWVRKMRQLLQRRGLS